MFQSLLMFYNIIKLSKCIYFVHLKQYYSITTVIQKTLYVLMKL